MCDWLKFRFCPKMGVMCSIFENKKPDNEYDCDKREERAVIHIFYSSVIHKWIHVWLYYGLNYSTTGRL